MPLIPAPVPVGMCYMLAQLKMCGLYSTASTITMQSGELLNYIFLD